MSSLLDLIHADSTDQIGHHPATVDDAGSNAERTYMAEDAFTTATGTKKVLEPSIYLISAAARRMRAAVRVTIPQRDRGIRHHQRG